MNPSHVALGRALEFFGDHRTMARALGISNGAMWRARYRGRISGRLANKIHRATAGNVRREELRPDLFPRVGKAHARR